jgi:Asp-tRNA(Asn)/Glu-tRNA(Gln) amidotransferase B subunit
LTVGEKIALALRGGREVRSILCKDSNKEVVLSVIKNPKVTDSEAELIAHSRNIPEEALRIISKNREWMKNYNVVLALVNNPKTPTGIAMNLVPGLKKKDLATLEKNKNVPEAVRVIAKKLVSAKKYS